MIDIETRRKQIRESQRKRRERSRLLGLCTICGKVKADPGRVTCSNCRKIIVNARSKHDMV